MSTCSHRHVRATFGAPNDLDLRAPDVDRRRAAIGRIGGYVRAHHGQQSHEVIASATTEQLGMAAAGQIQLAVVSAGAGDRDSADGTVISMAPSHCQSTFVLQSV